MGRFEDYPGLVGTGVQLLENRLGATPQGFESLPLRHLAAKHRITSRKGLPLRLFYFWRSIMRKKFDERLLELKYESGLCQ